MFITNQNSTVWSASATYLLLLALQTHKISFISEVSNCFSLLLVGLTLIVRALSTDIWRHLIITNGNYSTVQEHLLSQLSSQAFTDGRIIWLGEMGTQTSIWFTLAPWSRHMDIHALWFSRLLQSFGLHRHWGRCVCFLFPVQAAHCMIFRFASFCFVCYSLTCRSPMPAGTDFFASASLNIALPVYWSVFLLVLHATNVSTSLPSSLAGIASFPRHRFT